MVTAKSTDGSPAISNLMVISLGNVDDNATAWSSTPAPGIAVDETLNITRTVVRASRESLADFRAGDADGQTVKYGLAGDTAGMFSIDSNGVLYRTRNVDYETNQHQFSVTVWAWGAANTGGIAKDGAGISKLFILTINNVNEFTAGFAWAEQPIGVKQWRNGASGPITVNVNENNAVGMAVGQFAATDGDQVAVNYSLSGADAGNFSINNNGTLTLKSSLNYEDGAHGKNYSVVVTAKSTDASAAVSSLFVLSLNNVDENATVWSSTPVTRIAVDETAGITGSVAAGALSPVGTFKALDADGQFVSYWLTQDTRLGGGMFSIDSNGTLYRKYDVDYETGNRQFSVVVGAWGAPGNGVTTNGAGISQLFILTINAVDEAPVWSTTPLGSKLLTEVDGATYNYTAPFVIPVSHGTTSSGRDPGTFTNYANGAVVTVPFDVSVSTGHAGLNQSNAYIFYRVLGDNTVHEAQGGVTFAKGTKLTAFQIGLKNTSPLTYQFYSGDFVAPLNAPGRLNIAGGIMATFAAWDPEGASVKYSVSGTDASNFIIDANGKLILTQSLDYETAGAANYSVVVVATDNTGHATSQNFIVSLFNTNDEFSWSGTQVAGVSLLELTGTQVTTARAVATFTAVDTDAMAAVIHRTAARGLLATAWWVPIQNISPSIERRGF